MATAGDGRAADESGGAGVKLHKRPFQPEINEEPQNVSQEAGQTNLNGVSEVSTHQCESCGVISATAGKSELEQILKQMIFTRSEAQCLIALVHSRTMDSFMVNVDKVDPLHNRPPRGRDRARRIKKIGENTEAKTRHREKIEKYMEAHLTTVEEKKARRQRLEEHQVELIEQQILINHLTIMEKGGIKEEDMEIVDEAKSQSRSWLKKFFKKRSV